MFENMNHYLFLATCAVVGSIGLILMDMTLIQALGVFLFVSAYTAGNSNIESVETERILREIADRTKGKID